MTDFPYYFRAEESIVMVAQNKLDPAAESLFNRTFGAQQRAQGDPVISTGQIKNMTVPHGWEARATVSLPAGAGLTEFHAPGNEDIRINSYYRGHRVGQEAARAFKDCLAKAPHQLHATELESLSDILGDKGDNFDILSAKTMDLNGKRVLSVEGAYKDKDHTGAKTIYIDSDGGGSAVQEISYSAGGKDYQAHQSEAEKAFKSIVWK